MGPEAHKTKRAGEQQRLELLQDDPAGFELFVKWLYQGRLDDTAEMSAEKKYDHAVACHKLYRLCEKFDMPELKNLSMDQYRICLFEARLVPDADEINEIYKVSPEGSPFRRLMTKIAARQIMDPDSDKDAESYRGCFQNNPDFAIDLVNAIKMGSGGILFDDPTDGGLCEYHDHSGGAGCGVRPREKGKSCSPLRSPSLVAQTLTVTREQPPKMILPEQRFVQMLKALPTTSSTDSSGVDWLSDTTLISPIEEHFPDVPPPTPARPMPQVKAKQMELALSSAMGAMDAILEEDRQREMTEHEKAGKKDHQFSQQQTRAPRGEDNPLSYVAALRLRQGHGRRKSRDLFEGVEGQG